MNTEFKYSAFISYRHTPQDKKWAKWLINTLETFKVPKELVKAGHPKRLGKIYRDEDEFVATANLSDHIVEALKSSQYLIVICSKDTPNSKWVDQEIKAFRDLGREENILALLVEGEPRESFPKELWVDVNGNRIEPVAADVRPRSDQKTKETKDQALMRLIAGIVGCSFDELRRRDKIRTQRRRRNTGISIVTLVTTLSVLFMGYRSESLNNLNQQKADLSTKVILETLDSVADESVVNPLILETFNNQFGFERENDDIYFKLIQRFANQENRYVLNGVIGLDSVGEHLLQVKIPDMIVLRDSKTGKPTKTNHTDKTITHASINNEATYASIAYNDGSYSIFDVENWQFLEKSFDNDCKISAVGSGLNKSLFVCENLDVLITENKNFDLIKFVKYDDHDLDFSGIREVIFSPSDDSVLFLVEHKDKFQLLLWDLDKYMGSIDLGYYEPPTDYGYTKSGNHVFFTNFGTEYYHVNTLERDKELERENTFLLDKNSIYREKNQIGLRAKRPNLTNVFSLGGRGHVALTTGDDNNTIGQDNDVTLILARPSNRAWLYQEEIKELNHSIEFDKYEEISFEVDESSQYIIFADVGGDYRKDIDSSDYLIDIASGNTLDFWNSQKGSYIVGFLGPYLITEIDKGEVGANIMFWDLDKKSITKTIPTEGGGLSDGHLSIISTIKKATNAGEKEYTKLEIYKDSTNPIATYDSIESNITLRDSKFLEQQNRLLISARTPDKQEDFLIRYVDLLSGDTLIELPVNSPDLIVSPERRKIAFELIEDGLGILDLESLEIERKGTTEETIGALAWSNTGRFIHDIIFDQVLWDREHDDFIWPSKELNLTQFSSDDKWALMLSGEIYSTHNWKSYGLLSSGSLIHSLPNSSQFFTSGELSDDADIIRLNSISYLSTRAAELCKNADGKLNRWLYSAGAKLLARCLTPSERIELELPPNPPCYCQEKQYPDLKMWSDNFRNQDDSVSLNETHPKKDEILINPFTEQRTDGWTCPPAGTGHSAPWNDFEDLSLLSAWDILGPADLAMEKLKDKGE